MGTNIKPVPGSEPIVKLKVTGYKRWNTETRHSKRRALWRHGCSAKTCPTWGSHCGPSPGSAVRSTERRTELSLSGSAGESSRPAEGDPRLEHRLSTHLHPPHSSVTMCREMLQVQEAFTLLSLTPDSLRLSSCLNYIVGSFGVVIFSRLKLNKNLAWV